VDPQSFHVPNRVFEQTLFTIERVFLTVGMVIAYTLDIMETIAITKWNDIISPMFDVSCCIVIVQPDGSRKSVDVRDMSLFEKAECCCSEKVTVMICGAISNIAKAILEDKNITVYSWIRGSIDDVVAAYQRNVTISDVYAMPGCRYGTCRRKRRFRHRKYQSGSS